MKRLIKGMVFILTIMMIIVYSMTRIVFTIISAKDYAAVEITFATLLLLGELFILIHALGYAVNLLRASFYKDIRDRVATTILKEYPSVAILVPARHEPRDVLEKTFSAIERVRYPNKYVYFLDDSTDKKYKKEAEEIAEKFDLMLFRRKKPWHGAKAGIVNDCLASLTEKYIVIFDADQCPMPQFLRDLVPVIEGDEKLAFIQTPQFYSNADAGPVAKGATYQQSVFYEYICEAKSTSESMFCCGTNVIFRRDALLSVGGFDEKYVTEDFATSIALHMKGYRSLYYNHVGTMGMAPETLGAFFVQQSRWARGTLGVFRKVLRNFFTHPFKLSIMQWWEYFLSSTYYFVGIAFTFLMICPIAYILFNVPSFFIHTDIYLSAFIPYFSLSLGIFLLTLRARNYPIKSLFIGQLLTYITFPVYIVSAVSGLLGIQGKFGITLKGAGEALPYTSLWPQFVFMFVNYIALVWGINRFYYERDYSVLINSIWALYHFLIMLSIFYFNVSADEEAEAA